MAKSSQRLLIVAVLSLVFMMTVTLCACTPTDSDDVWGEVFTYETAYAEAQELGYTGSLQEFIASITGKDGIDGIGIKAVTVNSEGNLIVTLTNNTSIDCGNIKGQKGDAGAQGPQGEAGKDGTDGITPQIKIGEDDFWYVSYDNGATWTSLGVKATGTDGINGTNGADGQQGSKGDKGDTGVGITSVALDNNGNTVITYSDGTIQTIEHNWEKAFTLQGDCETGITELYSCTKCGLARIVTVEAQEHNWETEFTVDKAATCTDKGSKSIHCKNCTATKDVTEIPANEHEWNTEFTTDVEPTCTEKGSKSIHCANCTATKDVTEIPANGHSFDESKWESDETGHWHKATCGHDVKGSYEAHSGGTATCVKRAECEVCGEEYGELGDHNYGEWINEVPATCTTVGTKGHYHCSDCGNYFDSDKNLFATLSGKYISVLGDSISTFNGINNDSANSNSTIGGNAVFYPNGEIDNVNKTWWQRTANILDMNLLVNNSWSGSRVFNGNGVAYGSRSTELHGNVGSKNGINPDVIAIYMGVNDFDGNVTLGSFASLDEIYASATGYVTPQNFAQAYAIMLHKITQKYGDAKVLVITIPANGKRKDQAALDNYNDQIRYIATYFGCQIVDLANVADYSYSKYTFDDLHPNELGMQLIADLLVRELSGMTIPAKGHEWNTEFTTDIEPTCTDKGSKSIHCKNCSATKDVTKIPANGHEWNTEFTTDVEPTCTDKGSKSIHCKNCTATKDVTEIPANGHSFDETTWESDETGHWHPATCGHDAKGSYATHSGGTATCSDQSVCEVCEKEYYVHSFDADGVCTGCGYFETGLKFRLNNDGESWSVSGIGTFEGAELKIPAVNYDTKPVICIDVSAFGSCSQLTSVIIPNSITVIDDSAFLSCTGLTSITIPDSVTTIGYMGCFSQCSSLKTITIGTGLTSIGMDAFTNCENLESITVAEGNATYHSAGNCLIETESKTLVLGCKTSIIPTDGSVTSIGKDAFCGCTGLTNIIIPDSVVNIDDWAFVNCTGLTSITIPDSVTNIGKDAFGHCAGLTSITIPDSVTSIGSEAFYDCSELTRIDYDGTTDEWLAIEKSDSWNSRTGEYVVYCTDGTVAKDGTVTKN